MNVIDIVCECNGSESHQLFDSVCAAAVWFAHETRRNLIQAECNLDKEHPPFPSKTQMPLCILNLVLKEHGIRLED